MAVVEVEMIPNRIHVSERSAKITFAGKLGTLGMDMIFSRFVT